ncbi:telomere binding protein [Coemansia sp. RSA 2399]|nr:telomere binding protein [Coemansia sp. RSA 2399]KAJ1908543.1 telomere binding protein [Coemansia sp. IMI 209127]
MVSSREEIKRRFRELEQYIGAIVRHDVVKDDKKDERLEPADGIVELKFPGTVGGAAVQRPLITPIVVDAAPVDNEQRSVDSRRLRMALQLPLVALGSITLDEASNVDSAESAWWLDTAQSSDNERTVSLIATRFVGLWFRAAIIGTAAGLILDDAELMDVAQKYLSDRVVGKSVVFVVAAVFGSKPDQRNECSIESLTLATKLLTHAVSTGLLGPQTVLAQTNSNVISPRSSAYWTSFLQIMCSLPERVANRVDPQSIPPPLLPRQYFSRLAREAVALFDSDRRMARIFVVDLWIKLCSVGQSHFVSMELAAAALAVAPPSEPDRLMSLVQTLCSVPVPFRETLVYGTVCQLERIARDAAGAEFRMKLTAVLGALLYCQIDPAGLALPAEQAVAGMLFRGSQTYLTETTSSPVVLQALVLAMQQLVSGNLPAMPGTRELLLPKYDRTFPDLIHTALQRTIIPMWSGLSFAVRPTTALVLLCVGGMVQKEEERERLAMTSEFANAIPRFLDAPTPRVRLSGIVVADCVISGEDVDFGLDDILRDAQRPGAPDTVVASAKYIQELRAYVRPIAEQWTDTHCKPLDEAIDHARAYAGEEEEEEEAGTSRVLAPRQSSMHSGSEALQSGFVKPRTPAFLRDCLAYLKPPPQTASSDDSGGNNAERVRIGLFALTKCIEAANAKTVEEMWLQAANRMLYTYNRGPDHLDAEWDAERRSALVALAVRLPKLVGPFLADRSCDRNVTLRDRELVLSAIATACIQMTDVNDIESATKQLEQTHIGGTLGTVVRRSRRLDIAPMQRTTKRASADIEPSFFFPLVAQFGRSDMSSASSDIRRNAAFLERYLSTLGVILYTCGSSTHQIAMAREFWGLCRLVRALQDISVSESPPVLEALLFGIDVILSPERSLSIPTLAREFRLDIADTLQWIGRLLEEREALLVPSAVAHASRILARLREIQEKVYTDYTSII